MSSDVLELLRAAGGYPYGVMLEVRLLVALATVMRS